MKVLHINSYYSSSFFYKNLFEKQIQSSMDISVYVPVSKDVTLPTVNLGKYTNISENHSKYDRMFFHIKHQKIFKDIVRQYEIKSFDLVHAHSLFSNGYIAFLLKKKYNIPYIVAVRNTDVNVFFKYMIHLRKLGLEILKEAEKIIFLSDSYNNFILNRYIPSRLRKNINSKTTVIPNGIADFWLQNADNPKDYSKERGLKVLQVGVIDKNKNVLTTIEAVKLLINRGYNAQLTIVGKIVDEGIYNQIRNLPFVKYKEPILQDKLLSIFRQHQIFIMPSIKETFGLVYAEAMSQGLPVIYSKGQGFDGQFKEGVVGYRVDSLNEEEIANRVEDIISNYKNISFNCINKIEKFSWDNIVDEYNKLYLKVNAETSEAKL
ncbi:glycosyltransferase family 4 protein [Priestia endophytica]|uniref:glycosyltransferase family 4 protein n=1 Tax=Priestia endophytica TaxID=135735 RepID=UPI00203B714F|nr:glycosyltransferase family 4 protein [Priestia endophytica]MCM3539123.1 glycosyltransferase family 4 protein [Priestia endophytica]